jgi:GNAT superfamily N-acetyltransferase
LEHGSVICWEALAGDASMLLEARRLYETTFDAAESIPWAWIEEGVYARQAWRPGSWSPHLLCAAERDGPLAAFAYGAHVPDFCGYAIYLAVKLRERGQGLGARLLRLLLDVLRLDAAFEGVPLPFVLWESRAPQANASEQERDLWRARLRLFARVGAWAVDGITLFAPNFAQPDGEPVPLQLFLVPQDLPAVAFDPAALRTVVAGLLWHVYDRPAGDPLYQRTLPPGCTPVLRPITDAVTHSCH